VNQQFAMPSKLRFKVCYCSGEDPDFPASELNAHTPHTRGWQTPRFCEYPQEIGVQFASVSDIQQLQVLSHQSKIATRIEIFVGTAVEGDPRPAYSRAKFKRMGYVSLDPNERSNFQARELKTVQFNSSGLFLKLVVHKCSVNRLNIYSQARPFFLIPFFISRTCA
jgi:centrosomal protein CEP104